MNNNYLKFRKVWFLLVPIQVVSIVSLFIITTAYGYWDFKSSGLLFGYPLSISILFVPIYEEIIFRGFILEWLTKQMRKNSAIIISSLLFGLWHLKNIFFLTTGELIYQMLYTALIFGPIVAVVTLRTRTIWIAVIIHYLHNILSAASWDILAMLNKLT